jgi:hypothetical protein
MLPKHAIQQGGLMARGVEPENALPHKQEKFRKFGDNNQCRGC